MSSRDIEPELTPLQTSPYPLPEVAQPRREPPTIGMDYLSVPPALGWGRTRASAHSPLFRFAHNFFMKYIFHNVYIYCIYTDYLIRLSKVMTFLQKIIFISKMIF